METKLCSRCGTVLTEENTSKAYKTLCKDCYAKLMRYRRQLEKDKQSSQPITLQTPIDWERVRIEAAIEITAAIISVPYRICIEERRHQNYPFLRQKDDIVEEAVELSDMLVEKLKGGKE